MHEQKRNQRICSDLDRCGREKKIKKSTHPFGNSSLTDLSRSKFPFLGLKPKMSSGMVALLLKENGVTCC